MGNSPVDQAWTPLLNRVVSLTHPTGPGFNKSGQKRSTRFSTFFEDKVGSSSVEEVGWIGDSPHDRRGTRLGSEDALIVRILAKSATEQPVERPQGKLAFSRGDEMVARWIKLSACCDVRK